MKLGLGPVMAAGIVCVVITGQVRAAPAPLGLNAPIRAATSQVRLSAGMLHQDYAEADSKNIVPTSYVDKETGPLPALALDAAAVLPYGVYAGLHVLYAGGRTDYDGYKQNVAHGSQLLPYTTTTHNHFVDTRAKLGYMIGIGTRVAVAPLVTLGYSHWNRHITGSGNTISVEEDYDAYRYGLGLDANVSIDDRLTLQFEGIYGRQHATIGSRDLDASLGVNAYTRLAVGLDYRLTKRVHLGFYTTRVHYHYDQSATNRSGFFEPRSKTTHLRFMASVGWALF